MFAKIIAKIAQILSRNKIPYMIIGGQALLQYGSPRLTEDIDITLGVGVESSSNLISLLGKMNLVSFKEASPQFIRKTHVLPCRDKETKIRVDFIFSFLPYERQAIARAKKIIFGKTRVNFASPEDLIIHKMFAGRPRDLEDVRNILLKQKMKLDFKYIHKYLSEFSSLSEHAHLLQDFKKLVQEVRT